MVLGCVFFEVEFQRAFSPARVESGSGVGRFGKSKDSRLEIIHAMCVKVGFSLDMRPLKRHFFDEVENDRRRNLL